MNDRAASRVSGGSMLAVAVVAACLALSAALIVSGVLPPDVGVAVRALVLVAVPALVAVGAASVGRRRRPPSGTASRDVS